MHLKLPLSAYTLSIDLPWFILAHALFLSVRGLHAVFAPPHDRKAELGLVYFGLGCACERLYTTRTRITLIPY